MSKRRKPLTERELEARRSSARRSTGPRTARGKSRSRRNALKHAMYARTLAPPPALFEFGEQANDYRALLAELLRAHAPSDDAERQLVEEISTLRWQRRRNLRAQHGLIRDELERRERQPLSRQAASLSLADAPWEEVREKGLLGAAESPGNFRQALDLLGLVRDDVETGEFAAASLGTFRTLFGCHPTMRQAEIYSLYAYFATGEGSVPEDDELVPQPPVVQSVSRSDASNDETDSRAEDAPPPGDLQLSTPDSQPVETASDSEPAGDSQPAEDGDEDEADLLDRAFFHDLRLAICEEMLAATERFERFLAERAPLGPSQRDACLAPRGAVAEWRLVLRQEEVLERLIDRRTRLLLELQRRRPARRPAPAEPEPTPPPPDRAPRGPGLAPSPAGEPAGRARPSGKRRIRNSASPAKPVVPAKLVLREGGGAGTQGKERKSPDSGFRRQPPHTPGRAAGAENLTKRTEEVLQNHSRPALPGRNEPKIPERQNANRRRQADVRRARTRCAEFAQSADRKQSHAGAPAKIARSISPPVYWTLSATKANARVAGRRGHERHATGGED